MTKFLAKKIAFLNANPKPFKRLKGSLTKDSISGTCTFLNELSKEIKSKVKCQVFKKRAIYSKSESTGKATSIKKKACE